MCRQEIIKNTKRLAKKQMTWFKADPRINWIRTDNYDNIFDLIEHVLDLFNLDRFLKYYEGYVFKYFLRMVFSTYKGAHILTYSGKIFYYEYN